MNSPLGFYIKAYSEGQGLPRRAKVIILTLLWASLLYSCTRIEQPEAKILLGLIGIVTTVCILRMKSSGSRIDRRTKP